MRPYVLQETNWKQVKDEHYDIAILPWGATEPHNYHLPYGTDNYESELLAIKTAGIAWEKGAKCMVLPTIAYGVNTGQRDLPFAMNMNPSTQKAILNDTIVALKGWGIEKLVIFNSHGGNCFKQMIRELQYEHEGFCVFVIEWYKTVLNTSEYFDEPGDHAGELETSVMMHLRPDLVLPLEMAGDGGPNKGFHLSGLKDRWVWTERKWTEISKDTGVGNPKAATAEKGARFAEDVCNKIAAFLVELSEVENKNLYK